MSHPSPKRIVAGLAVCQILLLSNGVLMAIAEESDGGTIQINGTRLKSVTVQIREFPCLNTERDAALGLRPS